jgi:epoxyqueuosine reductase QueG
MSEPLIDMPAWLSAWMENQDIFVWGAADLSSFSTPVDENGDGFPAALSFALPMTPEIMGGVENGPNQAYADEYARINRLINQISSALANKINRQGFRAQPLAASIRSDTANIKGDFPHKTAATRAGLGWIGRHCQLITRPFGPWTRLGTVFTDLEMPCGPPKERSHCGTCTRCVEACPAGALSGEEWYPGIEREKILDVLRCDQWKKENYFQYHKGHNCGICSAVCPYGIKALKKSVARKKVQPDNRTRSVLKRIKV